DVGPGCHWIAVRLDDLDELASVERAILDRLGPTYLVDDILRQNKPYFSALRLEKLLMSLAIGLIVLVAALGVISTLVLTVTQKIKIIGVLAALGATPGGIQKIFLLQGLAMGLLGTTAGALLGVGLCWYLDRFGVIRLDPEVYLLDHLPFVVELRDLLLVVGAAALVALLATLYPAWRASRLDPVEALRRE
ncbi:MAG: FtsX-like permease family protein, partial [Acidobacteriota bacterium]